MQLRTNTYPRHLANRLEPGIGYDVIFVADLDGAIAVRSRDEAIASICRTVARAGLRARRGPRGVSSAELPRVAPHLLWVNPSAADLSRLRWSLPPGHAPRDRERVSVKDGSAALHVLRSEDTSHLTPAA
jgi:hypothetical protein